MITQANALPQWGKIVDNGLDPNENVPFCNAPHHVRSAPSRKLRQKTNEIKAKMTADMKLWFTWECYWGWRYTATCLSTRVAWSFYNVSDVINESGWELLKACGIINNYSSTPAVIQIHFASCASPYINAKNRIQTCSITITYFPPHSCLIRSGGISRGIHPMCLLNAGMFGALRGGPHWARSDRGCAGKLCRLRFGGRPAAKLSRSPEGTFIFRSHYQKSLNMLQLLKVENGSDRAVKWK